MASIRKKRNTYTIQHVCRDGKRREISAGKNKKAAQTFCSNIERIDEAQKLSQPLDPSTANWLSKCSDELKEKLAKLLLIDGTNAPNTVGGFTQFYIDGLRPNRSPATIRKLENARSKMVAILGSDTLLAKVTAGDAHRFESELLAKHSENHVRRTIGHAKLR